MKTRLFLTGKILSCKAKNTIELTQRLVFEGPTAENFQSLRDVEPNLQSEEPNAKDFDKDLAREKAETAEGRNIIRGQAILMLKRYQYEPDTGTAETEGKRQQLRSLDSLIVESRRTEAGLKDDGKEYTEAEKTTAATELKTQLDKVRGLYTDAKTNKLVPPPLKVVDIEATDTELARNQLRAVAQKFLKETKETDKNKDNLANLKKALALSIYAETGELYNQTAEQVKAKFGSNATKIGINDNPKDTPPLTRKINKTEAAKNLKSALDTARS